MPPTRMATWHQNRTVGSRPPVLGTIFMVLNATQSHHRLKKMSPGYPWEIRTVQNCPWVPRSGDWIPAPESDGSSAAMAKGMVSGYAGRQWFVEMKGAFGR